MASSPLAAVPMSKLRLERYELRYLAMLPSSSTISSRVLEFVNKKAPVGYPCSRHEPGNFMATLYLDTNYENLVTSIAAGLGDFAREVFDIVLQVPLVGIRVPCPF